MNINLSGIGNIGLQQISSANKNNKISFQSAKDIVDISPIGKEKSELISQLTDIGYKPEYASKLVREFYQDVHKEDSSYEKLVNGVYDADLGDYYAGHCIKSRTTNLTPAEAIVYVEEEMEDYYWQYLNGCDPSHLSIEENNYDIGEDNFSPLELAKYMNKGFDIILAGMILKGKMDEETARAIQGYYEESESIKYETGTPNIQLAECLADRLSKNLDRLDSWTSDEKDEEGNLKSGLLRPLSKYETAFILNVEDENADAETINRYIKEWDRDLYRP